MSSCTSIRVCWKLRSTSYIPCYSPFVVHLAFWFAINNGGERSRVEYCPLHNRVVANNYYHCGNYRTLYYCTHNDSRECTVEKLPHFGTRRTANNKFLWRNSSSKNVFAQPCKQNWQIRQGGYTMWLHSNCTSYFICKHHHNNSMLQNYFIFGGRRQTSYAPMDYSNALADYPAKNILQTIRNNILPKPLLDQ